jgi:hypothetical protein
MFEENNILNGAYGYHEGSIVIHQSTRVRLEQALEVIKSEKPCEQPLGDRAESAL